MMPLSNGNLTNFLVSVRKPVLDQSLIFFQVREKVPMLLFVVLPWRSVSSFGHDIDANCVTNCGYKLLMIAIEKIKSEGTFTNCMANCGSSIQTDNGNGV